MSKQKMTTTVRVALVLAVLLCLSLLALVGLTVAARLRNNAKTTVAVPDNQITPQATGRATAVALPTSSFGSTTTAPKNHTGEAEETAAVLRLHQKHAQDNALFSADNMLPGDSVRQYYCVKAFYQEALTVNFRACVRETDSLLSEVLNIKVELLTTGEVLYNGRMAAMPDAVSCRREQPARDGDELYYAVTVYLDTSVGNASQGQALTADFTWWGTETQNLAPDFAATGATSAAVACAVLAAVSGGGCLVLAVFRKRKEATAHAD